MGDGRARDDPERSVHLVYPPQMDLTADELDHYEDKAQAVVQAITELHVQELRMVLRTAGADQLAAPYRVRFPGAHGAVC